MILTAHPLDSLPGELTGGRSIAITGTIAPDGTVGPIGGAGQKALTARSIDADLFIVPIDNLEDARDRAGDLEVVGVRTLDDALAALEDAGGEPVQARERAAA